MQYDVASHMGHRRNEEGRIGVYFGAAFLAEVMFQTPALQRAMVYSKRRRYSHEGANEGGFLSVQLVCASVGGQH